MDAPPIIAQPRQRQNWWWLGVLLLTTALMVLFFFNPTQYGFYPRCMMYTTTGLYCPGCGALRATHQLLHGHLLTALRCNVLLVVGAPYAAYFFARVAFCWMKDRPWPLFFWMQTKWMTVSAVVVIAFTIFRNIRVAPFTYLAPPE
jgi:hypothetical protein